MSQTSPALPSDTMGTRPPENIAVQTFLARYAGGTRVTYTFALRRYFNWCADQGVPPMLIKRPLIEAYVRSMGDDGLARATVSQQLGIIRTFYKTCVLDEYLDKDPSVLVKGPRNWRDDSQLVSMSRWQLSDLFKAAHEDPTERCAVALMGALGLRVSEAAALRIEDTQHEAQSHRVIRFVGKGGKPATIPLPVNVQRAIDACIGDRTEGPLLVRRRGPKQGEAHDRRSLAWIVQRLGVEAGIPFKVHPHMLRHSFVSTALDTGLDLRTVQVAARHADPRTTAMYDRARHALDRHAVHTVGSYLGGIV